MMTEYLTLGAYFALLLLMGLLFSRFNRNLSDFARAGGQLTWWMAGSSMLMAGISAFTFTGNASSAFEAGPSLLVIYIANTLGFVIGALWLGPWYRQTRAFTNADVVKQRFGAPAEQFSAYTGLVLGPFAAAVQLWALSVFVSAVFGFPLTTTIVVVGLIVVAYSAGGGAWAVVATDFVQGIILFAITTLVAILAYVKIGGIDGFMETLNASPAAASFSWIKDPGAFAADRYTWQWATAIFLMQLVSQLNMSTASRYLGVKDGREASRAAWLACLLMAGGSIIWFFPPMVARLLYEAQVMGTGLPDPATTAYAVVARNVLPNGLLGIMIAAMFAATMSSMDSGLNSQTSTVVRNLLPQLRQRLQLPPLNDDRQLRLCRSVSVALGVLIILMSLALSQQNRFALFDAFLTLSSVIGVPLTLPLVAGVFIRRLPAWSYFAIFGASVVPSAWSLIDESINGQVWTVQSRALVVLVTGTLATIGCVLLQRFSSATHREREQQFFQTMFTPVDFAAEIGSSRDAEQATLLGRCVVVVGVLMLALLLVPNTVQGRLVIVGLSLGVALLGGLMWMAGRRR